MVAPVIPKEQLRFSIFRYLLSPILLLLAGLVIPGSMEAAGTPDLYQAGEDPVMLLIGDSGFGNFGSYSSPTTSQLRIRIAEPGEVIYFGLSRAYRFNGNPQNYGQYQYRVRRVSDNEIVLGPITVNSANENLSTWEQANIGPSELNGAGGYETPANYQYTATEAGDYVIEFNSIDYLGLWDICVANNGVEKTGRVFSQNWAFRVPEMDPELPDCVWGAELNARFYSYTSDGFVTMIDFADSGFQPLSFNLAFNRTGPGNTGDIQLDRMSVPEVNLTGSSAEHLIFIDSPDEILFPDGTCGFASVEDQLQCTGAAGYCIPVSVSVAGQVEVIIDFNGNGVYDEDTDPLLAYTFEPGGALDHCVEWDGFLPDGSAPADGATVDIIVNYTQGVQHWALFDGEFMREGFCVTPIRPSCDDGSTAKLYYDDRNIVDEPGTPSPKDGRQGCDCEDADCRTWVNFDANTNDCDEIVDAATTGYGDKNTLNTWWFARVQTQASFDIPLSLATITGPTSLDHCPGEEVTLTLNWFSSQDIVNIEWEGPNGYTASGADQMDIPVTESGMYHVTVTDAVGCIVEADYFLMDVSCDFSVEIVGIACEDNNTDIDPLDDFFTAAIVVNGTNSGTWTSLDGTLSGDYGETVGLGPFLISNGDVTIELADGLYGCCNQTITLVAPAPCSNGCAITQSAISNNKCDDNGTPLDPSDDTYSFEVTVDGINLSNTWVSSEGGQGPYGEAIEFGPYPIAGGPQFIAFSDGGDADCTVSVTVTPPGTCSDQCLFTPMVSNIYCDDSGTPYDPLDDQFFFDLQVESINATNLAYEIDGLGLNLYGTTQTYGPFPIVDGDLEFLISDVVDFTCTQLITVPAPPTCSDECGIKIFEFEVGCDDFGTDDISDDVFYYDILVNSLSNSNTTWVASDGTTGNYGEWTRSVAHGFTNQELTIHVTDAVNSFCFDSVAIAFPVPELRCPDDVSLMLYDNSSVQYLSGDLSPERLYFDIGVDLTCWLDQDALEPGGRAYDRFTFSRDVPESAGLELFTFYLFSNVQDNSAVGAVFRISEFEPIDCCNLLNVGPITPWTEADLVAPLLPDSLYPEGMNLSQQFSVMLSPQEAYSMVTTTWSSDASGLYTWVVLSASGEELELTDPFIVNDFVANQTVMFDLRTVHLEAFLNQTDSEETLGRAEILAGCGVGDITFRDEFEGDCDTMTMTRTYDFFVGPTVYEGACSQKIGLSHLGLDEVVWPPSGIQFSCSDTFPVLDNGNPDPSFTGRPAIYDLGNTVFLDELGFAGLVATYSDVDSIRDDGGRNVIRTWVVFDQCLEESVTFRQLFKLDAGGVAHFSCPSSNHYCPIIEEDLMLFTTGLFDCLADVFVPLPELENICDTSNWIINTLVYQLDTLDDGSFDTTEIAFITIDDERLVEDLPLGDYFILYTGQHPDQLPQEVVCRFRVADVHEPVAICKSFINLSLPGNGVNRLSAEQVNQGSYDNCDDFTLLLRRQYFADPATCTSYDPGEFTWSDWGPAVDFTCCDVGGVFVVELMIIDVGGNRNYCTSYVTVRDNTRPLCTGLNAVSVSCDALPAGFSPFDTLSLQTVFGTPIVIDNCSAYAIELEPDVTGTACAPEQIVRRFLAVDEHGNEAQSIFEQVITVTPTLNYAIHFPMDTETDCVDNADTLRIELGGCDSITWTAIDAVLPTLSSECRRIARTYTVTNWCEWDGISPALTVSRDEDCNGVEGEADVWVLRRPDTTFFDADSLAYNDFPLAGTSGDACTGETNPEGYWRRVISTGRWQYTQIIQVFDEIAPEITLSLQDSICIDTALCSIDVALKVTLLDECQVEEGNILISWDLDSDGTIDGDSNQEGILTGGFPTYHFSYDFPIGVHEIFVSVTDDCGNESSMSKTFTIFDCYIPELECNDFRLYNLEALTEITDIDDDGELEEAAVLVEAIELGTCLFEDCSQTLIYSVNRVGDTVDVNQTSLYLDCNDRYQVELELYAWDGAFNPFMVQPDGTVGGPNWRSCTVTLLLQDPDMACSNCQEEESLTIAGQIVTEQDNYLSGVVVTVSQTGQQTVSSGNGRFQFLVASGETYTVNAYKNDDTRLGLSTIDMVYIQRHILGVETLSNPLLRLAADVNNDGDVNILDMIQLQRVILGIDEVFPNNTSWRFVPTDWDGEGDVPDGITLGNLESCSFDTNLRGVKIGDLNRSYFGQNSLTSSHTQGRSAGLPIYAYDQELIAGEVYELALEVPISDEFQGGQISLRWPADQLTYLGFSSLQLGANALNTQEAERGLLLFNWAAPVAVQNLITLEFEALATGRLSELVTLCDDCLLHPEMYTVLGEEARSLNLNWLVQAEDEAGEVAPEILLLDEVTLLGANPNPIATSTQLGIYSPAEQVAYLQVTDFTGRRITGSTLQLIVGENWIRVDARDWPAGMYAYTIELGGAVYTGKLMKK